MKKTISTIAAVLLLAVGLSACTTAADKASENLSKSAENFEVPRRIVGINGFTDNVIFSVEGFCSYEIVDGAYDVICKQPDSKIERTTMSRSDNTTLLVTQMGGVDVDLFRSRVIFRPETIIPDFDLATSGNS